MSTERNIEDWDALAEAMREELRESAWLLSLMNSQQQAILSRSSDSINEASQAIEDQSIVVSSRSARRALLSEQILSTHGRRGDAGFESLITLAPLPMRGLFCALREEGLALRTRLQRRSRQNQGLLKRAQAMSNEIRESLDPTGKKGSYTRCGNLKQNPALSGSVIRTSV